MADDSTKRRTTFSFLEEIKSLWREKFSAIEQTALAFSCNDSFVPVLKAKMEIYNGNPNAVDNIGKVQAQIDTVKDVMIENIDRVLERGEKIELLVDKTERLNHQAVRFEKSVSLYE
jgi:vesicle-associated membrane protein 7